MPNFRFNTSTVEAAVARVLGGANIRAWCIANCGKEPRIIYGFDEENTPTENDAPYIRFDFGSKFGGQQAKKHMIEIVIDAGVKQEQKLVEVLSDPNDASSITYFASKGLQDITALLDLIADEMDANLSVKVGIDEAECMGDIIDRHPLYTGTSAYRIEIECPIRCTKINL